MAGIFSWSSTPGSNTTVDGINIDEGCPAGNVNNALRSIMSLIRATFASGLETFLAGSAALPVANGGTGGTTQPTARQGLGATTIGEALFTLTNPSAIRFPRINADNSATALSGADFLAALGVTYTSNANGRCVSIPIGSTTILVQWGANALGAEGWSSNYTLPVALSTTTGAVILVSKTDVNPGAVNGNSTAAQLVSTTQFRLGHDDSGVYTGNWFVIGLG